MSIYRDLGRQGGEVTALNEAGTLYRIRGNLSRASACHLRALRLAREIGGYWNEAHALAGLGRCALAVGNIADAESGLRQAQEIFQRIGIADAIGVSADPAVS